MFEWVSGLDKGLGACGVSGGARPRSGHSIRQGQAHKPWWYKICWNKWPIYNALTRALEQAMEQVTQAQEKVDRFPASLACGASGLGTLTKEKVKEQKAVLNKWIRWFHWIRGYLESKCQVYHNFDQFELKISNIRGPNVWCVNNGGVWFIKWSKTRGWGGSAKQNLKY